MRRRLAMVGLLAALLGGAITIAAPTMQSTAEAHEPGTNGCTAVPDWGASFNFHDECDQHDLCYIYHSRGPGDAGRKACDDAFYRAMAADCDRGSWLMWPFCRNRADVYYLGVRWFGKPFFESPYLADRANTRIA